MSFQKLRPGEASKYKGGIDLTDGLGKTKRNNQKNASIVKEKYGNKKYYEPGIKDRLFTGQYSVPDTTNKDSINSYIKGYYDGANDQLNIMIRSNVITERVLKLSDNSEISLEELLMTVGYHDAFNTNIIFEELPEIIKNNKYYQEGYNSGYDSQKSQGRGRK